MHMMAGAVRTWRGWLLRTLPSLTSWLLILDWQMLEKCWKSGDKVLHNQHSLKILQNLDANCPPHFIHLTRPGCRGFDLELMPYQARMWDIWSDWDKSLYVYLRLCICWPLMCIWWNMSTDFRVITTPLLSMCTRFLRSNLHKQCNLCYLY